MTSCMLKNGNMSRIYVAIYSGNHTLRLFHVAKDFVTTHICIFALKYLNINLLKNV